MTLLRPAAVCVNAFPTAAPFLYHSLFWRTRLCRPDGGRRSTIHSITEVASDRAYLYNTLAAALEIK